VRARPVVIAPFVHSLKPTAMILISLNIDALLAALRLLLAGL
jgi:hypothetical protein